MDSWPVDLKGLRGLGAVLRLYQWDSDEPAPYT